MGRQDSNDDFTFTIEGKDYTITEKKNSREENQKKSLHPISLAIGAIISGICISIIFFGVEGISEYSEPLVEKQLTEEIRSSEITFST